MVKRPESSDGHIKLSSVVSTQSIILENIKLNKGVVAYAFRF